MVRRTPLVVAFALAAAISLAAPPAQAAPTAMGAPGFVAQVRPIDDALATRMRWSWRPGCPVPLARLRYLTLSFHGFDGRAHTGELVVRAGLVSDVVTAFHRLWDIGFPIRRMQLVDDFRGSDDASMAADNTSAFNCRRVTGGTAWSQHSYGRAVDVNPVQNPYVAGRTVAPPAGRRYLDRGRQRRGMLTPAARRAFTDLGWGWGGGWRSLRNHMRLKDYMHLSSNDR